MPLQMEVTQTFFNRTLGLFQSRNMPVGIFTTIHAEKGEGLNQVIKASVKCLDSTKEVCRHMSAFSASLWKTNQLVSFYWQLNACIALC